MENIQEKKQRTTDDIMVLLTVEEKHFRTKFHIEEKTKYLCTICDKSTEDDACPHPTLGVVTCSDCLQKFSNSVFLINKDGTDKNCRWCGLQAKKYRCSTCTVVFCKNCLERNFGVCFVRNNIVNSDNWKCLICEPKQLWRLRALCENAVNKDLSNQTLPILNVSLTSEEDCLPSSQLAEPYSEQKNNISSNESESETITTPKKICKPIEKYEDSDSLPESQMDEKLELFQTFKEFLEETKEDIDQFIHMFKEDRDMLFNKYSKRDINSYDQAKKIMNKISTFCDIAVKNINSIKEHSTSEFENWATIFNNSDLNCKLKQSEKLNNREKCDNKQENLSSPSNAKLKISPKYDNIDLSSTQTEIVSFLTNVRKSMSSDNIKSPTQPSTSADYIPETKETLNEAVKQINNNEIETVSKVTVKNEPNSEDILDNFDKTTIIGDEHLDIRIKEDFGEEICSVNTETNMVHYELVNLKNKDTQDDLELIEMKKIKMETKVTNVEIDIEDSSSNSTDVEIISDDEYERQSAYQNLVDSDMSDINTDSELSTISHSSSTSLSDSKSEQNNSTTGYIKELDLADEIEKLQKHTKFFCKINDQINDPKFFMQPVVLVEKIDYENSFNSASSNKSSRSESDNDEDFFMEPIVLIEKLNFENNFNTTSDKSSSRCLGSINDEDREIENLTNLSSLKKRRTTYSSDDDSEIDKVKKHKRPKKKRQKKSSSLSSSNSSSVNTDLDYSDLKTDSEMELDLLAGSKTFIPNDFVSDSLSDTSLWDDDDEEEKSEDQKTSKRKIDENVINIDDDSPKSADAKSKWRKEKLLTTSLNLSDSDRTSDETANDILQKQEERYFQNANKSKTQSDRNLEKLSVDKVVNSPNNVEDDETITVSDDTLSDTTETDTNSDIEIIEAVQKPDLDEETQGFVKKGRKNIKKVLTDSELQEETQKADKEETERKERLTLKQKTLETVLSESQLSEDEIGLVLDVDEVLKQPTVKVHPSLVPRLKPHQHKGIKFMWDVCYESVKELQNNKGAGCILAHCMGLGKTMQVIVLAHTLLTHPVTNVKHILIVCPLSTVFNWRNEFEKTLERCPIKINFFDIRSDCRKTYGHKMFEVRNWRKSGGVIIMGYESFQILVNEKKLSTFNEDCKQQMLEALIDPGPDLIVCDEGHMLKNGKSMRFNTISKIKTLRRIILTGTPLQNNLVEYYHMVNFVKPHLLGTLKEFYNRFVNPISNGQYENSNDKDIHIMKKRSHVLHKKLETTIQRFEESELIPYLPKRFDYVLFVQLTPLQIQLYELYLELLENSTRKLFKNYHALQNIWTHPALLKIKFDKKKEPVQKEKRYDEYFVPALDPDSEKYCLETDWFKDHLPDDISSNISYGVKMQILFAIIKECEAIGDKLLVFSSSIDELDLIEHFLKQDAMAAGKLWKKDLHYYRMDGTVMPEKRVKYCNEFNNVNNKLANLFLVSHKVGGFGLNLTAANRVVIMDVSWNPAYDIQSVFRVYRFGQNKNCYIYRLVSMGTMEEIVYSRAVTKLAISGRVVDERQIKRHFNSDDLQMMYTLNKDYSEEPHTPTLPSDRLLAKLWENFKPKLYKFCDHKSLLENLTHEELNEEDMKLAWEEFRKEVEAAKIMAEMSSTILQQQTKINSNIPGPSTNTFPLATLDGNNRIIYSNETPVTTNHRYKQPNRLPTFQQIADRVINNQLSNKTPEQILINNLTPTTTNTTSYDIPTTFTINYNPFTYNSNLKNFQQNQTNTRVQSNLIQIIPSVSTNGQKENIDETNFQVNVNNLQKNNVSVFPTKKSTTE